MWRGRISILALLVALVGPSAPEASLTDGLVAYYPFCGSAADWTGNGHDGAVNGASLTADRFGQPGFAYSFDGVNDRITVPHDSQLNVSSSQWTTVAWVWFTAGEDRYFLEKLDGASDGWAVAIVNGAINGRLESPNSSTYSLNVYTEGALSSSAWHCVAVVWDATATNAVNAIKIYVDGALQPRTQTSGSYSPGQSYDTTANLEIGNHNGYNFFAGDLDDIRIYDRALSASEIQEVLNSTATSPSDVRARQLDDGSKRVEVLYDLANAPAGGTTVSVAFSSDGGSTWSITPDGSALSGEVGPGVPNGSSHRVLWAASSTLPPDTFGTQFRARVRADSFPADSADFTVDLRRATLTGRVLDRDGLAVFGATVQLGSLTFTSNASGYFYVPSSLAGAIYPLVVSAPGTSKVTTEVVVGAGGLDPDVIALDRALAVAWMSGYVRDQYTIPVVSAEVAVPFMSSYTTTTDSLGHYSLGLPGRPDRSYPVTVRASAPGGTGFHFQAQEVEVRPAADAVIVQDFVLERVGSEIGDLTIESVEIDGVVAPPGEPTVVGGEPVPVQVTLRNVGGCDWVHRPIDVDFQLWDLKGQGTADSGGFWRLIGWDNELADGYVRMDSSYRLDPPDLGPAGSPTDLWTSDPIAIPFANRPEFTDLLLVGLRPTSTSFWQTGSQGVDENSTNDLLEVHHFAVTFNPSAYWNCLSNFLSAVNIPGAGCAVNVVQGMLETGFDLWSEYGAFQEANAFLRAGQLADAGIAIAQLVWARMDIGTGAGEIAASCAGEDGVETILGSLGVFSALVHEVVDDYNDVGCGAVLTHGELALFTSSFFQELIRVAAEIDPTGGTALYLQVSNEFVGGGPKDALSIPRDSALYPAILVTDASGQQLLLEEGGTSLEGIPNAVGFDWQGVRSLILDGARGPFTVEVLGNGEVGDLQIRVVKVLADGSTLTEDVTDVPSGLSATAHFQLAADAAPVAVGVDTDGDGTDDLSLGPSATETTCPPPAGLVVTGTTVDTTDLAWDAQPTAAGYTVWAGVSPDVLLRGSFVTGATAALVTDTPHAYRPFYFAVSACDAAENCGAKSASVTVDAEPDGMPDGWESAHGLSPTVDDSQGDPDTDGLANLREWQAGTDPQDNDSDDDALLDGAEVDTWRTNPLQADTDTGGEPDGSEAARGANPLVAGDDVDASAPSQPVVLDQGSSVDVTNGQLWASWSAVDFQSGVAGYTVGLGTTPGASDVMVPQAIGTATSAWFAVSGLIDDETYYFVVQAENGAGQTSAPGASDGVTAHLPLFADGFESGDTLAWSEAGP
jgi:hypothetical protein